MKLSTALSWQACSLLVSGFCVVSSSLSYYYGSDLPFIQAGLANLIISALTSFLREKTCVPWWKFFMVSVATIASDITGILSYNYTSLSSAQLLTTTSMFWCAPMSYLFFKRRINTWQFISILIGGAGITIIFITDGAGESRITGNLLAICSSVMYSLSTCLQEWLIEECDPMTYAFRVSISSLLLSIIGSAVQFKSALQFKWTTGSIGLLLLYGGLYATYMLICPLIMSKSNANEMNLSMLTSNFFSLGISIVLFKQRASWLYLAGFCCIPIAISIYSIATS